MLANDDENARCCRGGERPLNTDTSIVVDDDLVVLVVAAVDDDLAETAAAVFTAALDAILQEDII